MSLKANEIKLQDSGKDQMVLKKMVRGSQTHKNIQKKKRQDSRHPDANSESDDTDINRPEMSVASIKPRRISKKVIVKGLHACSGSTFVDDDKIL
jgi:hypothetical protein